VSEKNLIAVMAAWREEPAKSLKYLRLVYGEETSNETMGGKPGELLCDMSMDT
jgi:hypothetical protein